MFGAEIAIVQEVVKNQTQPVVEIKAHNGTEFLRICVLPDLMNGFLPMFVQGTIEAMEKEANAEEVFALVKDRLNDEEFLKPYAELGDATFTQEDFKFLIFAHQSEAMQKFKQFSYSLAPMYAQLSQVIAGVLEAYPTIVKEAQPEFPVMTVSTETFQREVLESDVPVILDVYGDLCPPCKELAPIFSTLCNELKGKVKFVKLNAHRNSELTQQLGVRSLPALFFYKDGELVSEHVGGLDRDQLMMKLLEAFVAKN